MLQRHLGDDGFQRLGRAVDRRRPAFAIEKLVRRQTDRPRSIAEPGQREARLAQQHHRIAGRLAFQVQEPTCRFGTGESSQHRPQIDDSTDELLGSGSAGTEQLTALVGDPPMVVVGLFQPPLAQLQRPCEELLQKLQIGQLLAFGKYRTEKVGKARGGRRRPTAALGDDEEGGFDAVKERLWGRSSKGGSPPSSFPSVYKMLHSGPKIDKAIKNRSDAAANRPPRP